MKRLFLPLISFACAFGALAQDTDKSWTGTWATAVEFTGPGDMPKTSLSNRALREIVQVSIPGDVLRMQLSNIHSKEPVEIKSIFIANAADSCDIDVKSAKYLTFNGKKSVTIAPGDAVYCDDIKFDLQPLQRLAVTVNYGENTPVNASSHRGSRTTSYIINGEAKPKTKFTDAEKLDHWYNISCIDVQTEKPTECIAIIGNSITDGRGSTTNMQNRWPDFLAKALGGNAGVLNLGIGGNAVVNGGLSEPAVVRFDRDILGQTGVTSVVIFEGVNDIGGKRPNHQEIVKNIIEAYTSFIAKSKEAGKKVYLATITPYKNSFYEDHFSEAARLTLNDWIRANKDVDGVIDFDAAVRDPENPSALRPEYSDDWLHLNPAGYEAMGNFAAEILSKD
ncbi:MAG: SGNH/GDSL hydrolase family protein [Muribaculaceae bacterium]|nr:SGNH/GDSL hydrolase family protein [Muribaculaceae bacterium]MDE6554082.1 SGNH/GDSL hydrolase family protein [Muribaculaceae bacterium]